MLRCFPAASIALPLLETYFSLFARVREDHPALICQWRTGKIDNANTCRILFETALRPPARNDVSWRVFSDNQPNGLTGRLIRDGR